MSATTEQPVTMSREEALDLLTKASKLDQETAHVEADDVLCQLLISLGYQDVVDAYNEIDKWFA